MPSYRVCFINEIPRNGKLFRCCQRSIVIRSARSPERAIEAAKKRFVRLEGIHDWKIHAGLIEIEAIEVKEQKNPPQTEMTRISNKPKPANISGDQEKNVRYRVAEEMMVDNHYETGSRDRLGRRP